MEPSKILAILLMAISWQKVWSSLPDPEVLKNIEEFIWQGQHPVNILQNNAIHSKEVVIFGTREFCHPLVAYASVTTKFEQKYGKEFCTQTIEEITYDGCVKSPFIAVAEENNNGTITVIGKAEVCYLFQWPNNGVSGFYMYDNKGDEYSKQGGIKVDWKKIRNKDILCQAIRYFDMSGLKLYLRKIFYIDWTKETGFSKFLFNPDNCIGDEYVDNVEAVIARVEAIKQKKAEEEAAKVAAAEEAARLKAESDAAAKAAEIAAAVELDQEQNAAATEEAKSHKKSFKASTRAQSSS